MHDYLRAFALHRQQHRTPGYVSPTSNTFLSPSSHPHTSNLYMTYMPYHDSPSAPRGQRRTIITLSPLSPTSSDQAAAAEPPSYEELYLQHPCPMQQSRLLELVRQLEEDDSSLAEEVCKFMMGLTFVVLIIVIIGVIFNWGRPMPGSMVVSAGKPLPGMHAVIKPGVAAAARIKTLCGGRCKIHA